MKFVLACYGMRGDVETSVVVGRELLRRGHDVRIAIPPNLVGFAEAAGLRSGRLRAGLAGPFGSPAQLLGVFLPQTLEAPGSRQVGARNFGVRHPVLDEGGNNDPDFAGGRGRPAHRRLGFRAVRCQRRGVLRPAVGHAAYLPDAANGQLLRFLPAPLGRRAMTVWDRLSWGGAPKAVEDAQRRELGLTKATCPWPRRIAERGSLEIQAYDEVCFPGLAAEWAKWDGQRPFVGTLTLELPADADDEAASWIAAGTPPIYFGFGSIAVGSAADTLEMISSACAQIRRAGIGKRRRD